eukprot:scaffold85246_cov45-Attheya_sp.AAC.2
MAIAVPSYKSRYPPPTPSIPSIRQWEVWERAPILEPRELAAADTAPSFVPHSHHHSHYDWPRRLDWRVVYHSEPSLLDRRYHVSDYRFRHRHGSLVTRSGWRSCRNPWVWGSGHSWRVSVVSWPIFVAHVPWVPRVVVPP